MRPTLLCLLLLGGCATSRASALESLQDAVLEYNDGLRWGRTELITKYLGPGQREPLGAGREGNTRLFVTECEITNVRMQQNDQAEAMVRVAWYRPEQGRLRNAVLHQTWRRQKDDWRITRQRWVTGAPGSK